jgi:hypothetical protein
MSNEKGWGARGWLRTLAGGLREVADIGATALTERFEGEVKALVGQYEGEVKIELGTGRLCLSDRIVERIVRAGATQLDDFELLDFGWEEGAYRVRARVQARTVVVEVVPTWAGWSTHNVSVRATTPTPPTLEDAPVANWFVARFVELLGGTSFAASVFAREIPEGLSWDGREVMLTRRLDLGMTGLKSVLTDGATASATFTHDVEGLWITIDGSLPTALAILKDTLTRLGNSLLSTRLG